MNRRKFLTTTGIALSTPLAGCLSSSPAGDEKKGDNNNQSTDDGSENEPDRGTEEPSGNNSCIHVSELSPEAQTEVQTAIETGEYEACGNLELLDEIDLSDDPVLISEGTAYEPVVAHGDAGPDAECSSIYNLLMEQSNRDDACVTPTDNEPAFEIRFEEQEGDTADSVRERIIIKNISSESQYISGYTLTYSSGYEYTFSGGLSLESRSKVAVVSQGAGDSVAESDPPTYYRNADLPELVLEDGKETVRLLNRENEVIVEAIYSPE